MREIVISDLRKSKWYGNLSDETEGNPPNLETKSDIELLELWESHCTRY